jgi:hypothetical protein
MNKEVLCKELDDLISKLDVIQEEKAGIKRELSVLLDNVVTNNFIEWAEEIHQQILNREAAMQLLRKDIIVLSKTIVQKKSFIYFDENKYTKMISRYKEQLTYLDNEFKTWSKDISDKFESIID